MWTAFRSVGVSEISLEVFQFACPSVSQWRRAPKVAPMHDGGQVFPSGFLMLSQLEAQVCHSYASSCRIPADKRFICWYCWTLCLRTHSFITRSKYSCYLCENMKVKKQVQKINSFSVDGTPATSEGWPLNCRTLFCSPLGAAWRQRMAVSETCHMATYGRRTDVSVQN